MPAANNSEATEGNKPPEDFKTVQWCRFVSYRCRQGGCQVQCLNRADRLATWLGLCSECVRDRDGELVQGELEERLHPELQLIAVGGFCDYPNRLVDRCIRRSQSLSGSRSMNERDRVPDGQMPGTRPKGSASPECRERSRKASDRPRSGEGGSASDSGIAVADGGHQATLGEWGDS